MGVDVRSQITIKRTREEVAHYASDPDHATEWYKNIEAVRWKTPRPLAVGSQFAFVAKFLGRRLSYTYEVVELVPADRFVMRTSEGPFPMETSYEWMDASDGGTLMVLRNRGAPTGFARIMTALMPIAIRSANRKDLRRLKAILERPS